MIDTIWQIYNKPKNLKFLHQLRCWISCNLKLSAWTSCAHSTLVIDTSFTCSAQVLNSQTEFARCDLPSNISDKVLYQSLPRAHCAAQPFPAIAFDAFPAKTATLTILLDLGYLTHHKEQEHLPLPHRTPHKKGHFFQNQVTEILHEISPSTGHLNKP